MEDNSTGNQYDPNTITVMSGTTLTFLFDAGSHNVIFNTNTGNPAVLSNSPSNGGVDSVGSSYTVTPTDPGTYYYFCSLHADSSDYLGESYGSDTGNMVGRIIVEADTTAPGWDAGSASATPTSASQIDLSWPTATDDSGTAFYDVFQASGASDPGKGAAVQIADNSSGTTLSATGLTAGVHYWYWITPVDGVGNAGPDLTADATTISLAASATASHVVQFSVNPTLSLSVSPSILDLGTLSPASVGTGSATVTVQSNDSWSMSVKSVGRDGVDDTVGDDEFFTADGGALIPVGRATWDDGSGAVALTAAGEVAMTGQAPTASAVLNFDYAVTLLFDDVAASNYQTTVLYTVTQP